MSRIVSEARIIIAPFWNVFHLDNDEHSVSKFNYALGLGAISNGMSLEEANREFKLDHGPNFH